MAHRSLVKTSRSDFGEAPQDSAKRPPKVANLVRAGKGTASSPKTVSTDADGDES